MLKRALPLLTRPVRMGFFEWESTLAVTSNQKKRNFKKRKRVSPFSQLNGYAEFG